MTGTPHGACRTTSPEWNPLLYISGEFSKNLSKFCKKKAPINGAPACEDFLTALLKEGKDTLRQLVRLRHHGRARLLQHLGARQIGSFKGKVSILNPAT